MQCITDKFDSLNIIECAIAQTYLSGTDCPGHWLALEGVGRGLDLNWTLVFQSKFTLLSYCLFSRFKASHWLRVRGKVLQWLFQRTTVQFYLLMSPPKLPWNLSKLVMQILTMAECLRKCHKTVSLSTLKVQSLYDTNSGYWVWITGVINDTNAKASP